MAKCEICGKGPQFGHNVSHSMRHTKRQFKPNIQKKTIRVAGKKRRIHICMKCLKNLDYRIATGAVQL
ncbi:MAG: 50S ribosomal protein L28 [Chloroflexi bacterium]|nr:MAG: 50S ribosomal protein L28 [Chloroflexota bacterium]